MRPHVDQRRRQILEAVAVHGSVPISTLAQLLDVHEATVRRDVDALVATGELTRRHGSAVSANGFRAEGQTPSFDAVIEMIVPVMDYYFGEIIQGAQTRVHDSGGRLVLNPTGYDVAAEIQQLQRSAATKSAGVLFSPTLAPADPALRWEFLDEASIWGPSAASDTTIVIVERAFEPGHPFARYDSVAADHALGMAIAVRHLIGLGHTRIGLVTHDVGDPSRHVAGYRSALAYHGLPEPLPVLPVAYDDRSSVARTVAQIASATHAGSLDAIIVHNDQIAIALQRELLAAGVRIPDELSIVAYDDEVARYAEIPLTAVAPPKQEIGRSAASMLLQRMAEQRDAGNRPAEPTRHLVISPVLVARQSTARRAPSAS